MQLLINGLIVGAILAVSTMGLTLTVKILGFFNFAHGTMMTIGAYAAFSFNVTLGLPFPLSVILAVPVGIGVALIFDRLVYVRMREAGPVPLLMTGIGVMFVLRSLVRLAYGSQIRFYDLPIMPGHRLLGASITTTQIIVIGLSVGIIFLTHLFLTRTKIGRTMRAVAGNPRLSEIVGVDSDKVYIWTWAVASSLAVISGVFLAYDTRLVPEMGWNFLIPVFVAMVLGGIGSIYGAALGGFIVGLAMEVSAGFIPPTYKLAVAFIIMAIVLFYKPTGLFAEVVE